MLLLSGKRYLFRAAVHSEVAVLSVTSTGAYAHNFCCCLVNIYCENKDQGVCDRGATLGKGPVRRYLPEPEGFVATADEMADSGDLLLDGNFGAHGYPFGI